MQIAPRHFSSVQLRFMNIAVVTAGVADHATPLLILFVAEGETENTAEFGEVNQAISGQISAVLQKGDFRGREGQSVLLYPGEDALAAERLLLVGVGKRESLDAEKVRRAAGTAVKQALRVGVERATMILSGLRSESLGAAPVSRATAEGVTLGSYVFDELKTKQENNGTRKLGVIEILQTDGEDTDLLEEAVRLGRVVAEAENFARTLGNLPGNVATPAYLGQKAEEIASQFGMRATILGPAELREESMGALLAVSQGSDEEPRLIILEHQKGPAGSRPLLLVGKGLTFDSGGISIKPAQSMEEMKFDMCGGAAVLGAMRAIGELDIPINVIGVVPSSENLINGRAMKPGDVIKTHHGKTVEVVNTDAEGRLILADALSYIRRFNPAAIVDAATLTGACVIALGAHASAALGNDESLVEEIRQAGARAGQRVWPLPMFEEYRDQIKSEYADIKNSGGRPAGTITAAWFLREFVEETPWVHLDIAGTAYGDGKLPYLTKGSTGAPTRLFVEWVLARAG
mgnify:CR=1 FL=1